MRKIGKHNVEFIVYLAGVVLLGLFYYPLKAAIQPPWLFVVVAVGWVLALRVIGRFMKKRLVRDSSRN